jgi:hypothetical protein
MSGPSNQISIEEGECLKRWRSFTKGGGRSMGSLIHMAQQNGWQPSRDHLAMSVDDDMLDYSAEQLKQIAEEFEVPITEYERARQQETSQAKGC